MVVLKSIFIYFLEKLTGSTELSISNESGEVQKGLLNIVIKIYKD